MGRKSGVNGDFPLLTALTSAIKKDPVDLRFGQVLPALEPEHRIESVLSGSILFLSFIHQTKPYTSTLATFAHR
jgi:hypothetical protein